MGRRRLFVLLAGSCALVGPALSPAFAEKARRRPAREDACAAFNAELRDFHNSFAREYGRKLKRLDDEREQLRALIASQRELSRQLRRQALRARHAGLRAHVARQARIVEEDTRRKQRELREIDKDREKSVERWKELYRERVSGLLSARPEGCRVAVEARD